LKKTPNIDENNVENKANYTKQIGKKKAILYKVISYELAVKTLSKNLFI
jgi:hypothetical protein